MGSESGSLKQRVSASVQDAVSELWLRWRRWKTREK